jgi:hypothetical protein
MNEFIISTDISLSYIGIIFCASNQDIMMKADDDKDVVARRRFFIAKFFHYHGS